LINFVDATNDANHYTKPPPRCLCMCCETRQNCICFNVITVV